MKRSRIDEEEVQEVTGDDPGDEDQEELAPPPVSPLSDDEIIEIRYQLFGLCPNCGNHVRGWTPGSFSAERYRYWHEIGIDPISGHRHDCDKKYLR